MADAKFEKVLKDIGLSLYTYRVYRRVSVKTAARIAEITPETVVRIENGRHPHCRVTVVYALADSYDMSRQMVWETF